VRILITGNMGYVGPVLVRHLRGRFPAAELIGYDQAFFGHCLTSRAALPESQLDEQIFGDVRDIPAALLAGVDGVVHLAAVSNDPMGDRFASVTEDVNQRASARLAALARDAGVRHFVFASSCSVYGYAEQGARSEKDETNPLTAYARSKIGTEDALRHMDPGAMTITCLRFATACGMSSRLRLDLVLNDFVACALAAGEITVLSDGTPWRPLIDVADMARALDWALSRPPESGGRFLIVNAGSDTWNYRVRELAEAVAAAVPGTRVSINTAAPPDRRSYRVDFSLFARLAPEHQPVVTLERSIARLVQGLRAIGFADREFRSSGLIRLRTLAGLIESRQVSPELRWEPVTEDA
jgi:nucleoside-diphosphate-sugar epimerase